MPDTTGVYHAAYVAAAGIYIAYVASLWSRGRRVRERMLAARAEADQGTAPPRSTAGAGKSVTTPHA
jgi:hypothetical protein